MRALGRAVHLLPAGEVFRGWSTSVAVCGELVTSEPDGDEDSRYCAECVHEALRWCAEPGAGDHG